MSLRLNAKAWFSLTKCKVWLKFVLNPNSTNIQIKNGYTEILKKPGGKLLIKKSVFNMNGISLLSQTSGSNLLGFSNTPTIQNIKVGAFFFKPKGQSRDKFCQT